MLDGGGSATERAQGDGTTRSLIQTRNLAAREKRKISRAISRLNSSEGKSLHSWLSVTAALGLAISFFAMLDFAIDALHAGVEFSQKALFGLLIGGGALLAIIVRRFLHHAREHGFGAGDRYAAAPGGFSVIVQGVSVFYPWRCVSDLKVSADHILIDISNMETLALCKAAFGNQDIAGFSDELERLWIQSRTLAPSPAPEGQATYANATSATIASSSHAPDGVLQLRQTRELSARERRQFMRLLRNNQPRKAGRKWLTGVSVVWWLAAGWFSFSVVAAVHALGATAPDLAWQLALAGITFWIMLLGVGRVLDYLRARRISHRDIGTTFAIEPDGFCTKSSNEQFKGLWRGIPTIVEDADSLFVMLNETVGSIVVKGAFEGQDVATFCAEAQRRWKAERREPAL